MEKLFWSFFRRSPSPKEDKPVPVNNTRPTNPFPTPPASTQNPEHEAPTKSRPHNGTPKDLGMERDMSLKMKTEKAVELWSRAGVDLSQHSMDFADSTASFRLRCKEHSDTLPEINLDLSEEELDELAPRVKESWLRLQAILES